jgi:hypothetical protein
MKTFEVQFRYRDRNEGAAESTVKVEASSLPGAVGQAPREFVKGLDRKQRFDMNKNGLGLRPNRLAQQRRRWHPRGPPLVKSSAGPELGRNF